MKLSEFVYIQVFQVITTHCLLTLLIIYLDPTNRNEWFSCPTQLL